MPAAESGLDVLGHGQRDVLPPGTRDDLDAIGLLRPSWVGPASGYRFCNVEQLQRLNRIVALKDLGFTLQQVQAILDEFVTAEELRGRCTWSARSMRLRSG